MAAVAREESMDRLVLAGFERSPLQWQRQSLSKGFLGEE